VRGIDREGADRSDRAFAAGVLAAVLICAVPQPATAQTAPPLPLQPPPLEAERPYLAGQIMRQSAWLIATTVRDVVGLRLAGPPPSNPSPMLLGIAGTPSGAGDGNWLAFNGESATHEPVPPQRPLWNAWANPSVTWSKHGDPLVGNQGHLINLALGVDHRLVERGVFGVLFNHERADYDTPPTQGTLKTAGSGVGAYGGYALTDSLVIDGLVMWKSLRNDVADPFSHGSYDSRRWMAASNLTGYHYVDQWRLSPTAGILWSRERQDAFVSSLGAFSPQLVTRSLTLSAGGQVGYGFDLEGGARLEPWLGLTASWDVSRSQRPPGLPGRELERFDLTVSPGVNLRLTDRAALTLKADFAGLARSNYRQTTAGGQLSVEF
jgi:hypothetical protein